MDKYIKKEDLGEAMNAIAQCAMENADNIRTEISISKGWKKNVEIKVVARDEASYTTLAESVYAIVEGIKPSEYCDALLAAIDLQSKEQNVESNKEEE